MLRCVVKDWRKGDCWVGGLVGIDGKRKAKGTRIGEGMVKERMGDFSKGVQRSGRDVVSMISFLSI